jgi:hypothetical protein
VLGVSHVFDRARRVGFGQNGDLALIIFSPEQQCVKKSDRGSSVHKSSELSKYVQVVCGVLYATACSTPGHDEMMTGKKWASRIYSRMYII